MNHEHESDKMYDLQSSFTVFTVKMASGAELYKLCIMLFIWQMFSAFGIRTKYLGYVEIILWSICRYSTSNHER